MADPSEAPTRLVADLKRWHEANLIDGDQVDAIAAFENARSEQGRQGRATRAIALLGGLTLVSGVGSLVAYNWDILGDSVKSAAMGVLMALSLFFVVRTRQAQKGPVSVALDVGAMVTWGLTLAALSLVSQIYAQDGELWMLLFAWCALTAPLMSFTRTRFANYAWVAGLYGSLMTAAEALDDLVDDAFHLSSGTSELTTALLLGGVTGTLAARLASSEHIGRATVGLRLYRWHVEIMGLFGGLWWLVGDEVDPAVFVAGLVSVAALLAATPSSVERLGWGKRPAVFGLVGLGAALALIPMMLPMESGFMAFVAFIAFWSTAWFLAERAGHAKNARFAVGVIGIRIVIASFELFQSMLVTGVVLVALGGAALFWSKLKWTPAADGGAT